MSFGFLNRFFTPYLRTTLKCANGFFVCWHLKGKEIFYSENERPGLFNQELNEKTKR